MAGLLDMYGPYYAGFMTQDQANQNRAAQQTNQGMAALGLLSNMQERNQVMAERQRQIALSEQQNAQVQGLLSQPDNVVQSALGIPKAQAAALISMGGPGALAKVMQENAKVPDKVRIANSLPAEQRPAAMQAAAGIAPQFHTLDTGGAQSAFTRDPVTNQITPVFSAPKTAAPASVPFEASGMTPEQYRQFKLNNAMAGATRVNVDARDRQRTFENENKIRDDFKSDPRVKAAGEMNSAFSLIETAYKTPSPANDLAMATKYMKILDPTSVVRESELAMAVASTGLLDKVRSYAENVLSGKKLNPTQRKDFYDSAKAINDAFQSQIGNVANEYRGIATQYGLNPSNVTPGWNQRQTNQAAPASGSTGSFGPAPAIGTRAPIDYQAPVIKASGARIKVDY